jgi:murein DD-endopeptidase MepM/ murein hydrolase activator NlpD
MVTPARRLALLVAVGVVGLAAACGPSPKPAPAPAPAPAVQAPGTSPVISGLVCPVRGSRYVDSFGPRGTGFHSGIDMLVVAGTPEVAVRAGSVHYVANEAGGGGNVAYLTGDDHNVYVYDHMLDFTGGDRHVTQGTLLGHVGQSGNADAPQLHFEIRIGGANGTRIDAYPTLRSLGC